MAHKAHRAGDIRAGQVAVKVDPVKWHAEMRCNLAPERRLAAAGFTVKPDDFILCNGVKGFHQNPGIEPEGGIDFWHLRVRGCRIEA